MIKHLTPRSKRQIIIARFLDIFNWKSYQYTDFFSIKWHWIRSSYLAQNQKDWIHHCNKVFASYSFKNLPAYFPPSNGCWPVKPNEFDSETSIIKTANIWKETYDYEYENEKTKATIWVVEREWERNWKKIRIKSNFIERKIDVVFRPALYGISACDYVMKNNETPLQTLRRMEKERNFRF